MQFRRLGKTEIQVSAISFGAGPVSTLMVGESNQARQTAVIARARDAGINWFDTAATYGAGQSEVNLGCSLAELGVSEQVHLATKVRLVADDLRDIRSAVRRSVEGSLKRLRVPRVTLLQLHNSITARRDDEPTSLTPSDVLGSGGVLEPFQELRNEGITRDIGLTGIGQHAALREVILSGEFATLQVPYHLLNPSAGREMPPTFCDTDYGNVIADCAAMDMGVLAIRVMAGGALADNPPSPHTLKTPFFPLALYERDRERAKRLQTALGSSRPLSREAVRFALAHRQIHSALIGFGDVQQIDDALAALETENDALDWDRWVAPLLDD
jgi:aryl-alcohol dehydrogenase-like predicted oxidoreductase